MLGFIYDLKEWLFWKQLLRKTWKNTQEVSIKKMNEPVDFVVLWVDDKDPEWKAEKEKYQRQIGIVKEHRDNGDERYRDWDLFHYWFRAVEKYAPWVRNVYLVTCGHVPEWLNLNAPKLKHIKHSDFIPQEYLPIFSSNPIEMNLHRIPGLSECFVYFNDDVFLCRDTVPEDFFRDGKPNCTAIAVPLRNSTNDAFDHMLFTARGAINNYFAGDIRRRIINNPEKWFSAQYGDDRAYNIYAGRMGYLPGMHFTHLAAPFRKSTYLKVWQNFPQLLDQTSMHRFRTAQDVQHIILTMWEILEGSFNPVSVKHHGMHFWDPPSQCEDIKKALLEKKYLSICINDSENVSYEAFCRLKGELKTVMETVLPEKCSFEI